MTATPPPTHPPELDNVLLEILRAVEAGLPLDVAAWCRRFPELAQDVREFCADLTRFGPLLRLEPHERTDDTMPLTGPLRGLPAGAGELPRLGGYELLGEIGRGGMGVVYRARPAGTEREVALKVFNPDQFGGSDGLTQLRAEFNSFCRLKHPHVMPVYHYGEDEGRPFYTMELIEGPVTENGRQEPRSLADEMPRLHRELRQGVELLEKVARAVHHAHQRQILHRDLKPANVLLDAAGEPRVADFGLAVRLSGGRTEAGVARGGSLPWMAPETLQTDRELTTAIDVWALGVILYEFVAGRRPFAGSYAEIREQISSANVPPPRAEEGRADRDLEAICLRCLQKEPAQRYGSAEALADDLARWRQGKLPHARERVGRGERLVRWCRANTLAALAPLVAILSLAGLAAAALHALRAQEQRTVEEVTRGNRGLAGHAASTILCQLQVMADALVKTADDPHLHENLKKHEDLKKNKKLKKNDSPLRAALEKARTDQNERLRRKLGTSGEGPLVTMILLNPQGGYIAETPPNEESAQKIWMGRDFFHQALKRQNASGLARVHVSRIFRSESDGRFKIALSMPVCSKEEPEVLRGVLMTTIATGKAFGLSPGSDSSREIVLVGPQDGFDPHQPPQKQRRPEQKYLLLLHPAYDARELNPLFFDPDRLPQRRTRGEDDELDLPPADAQPLADEDYRDPMAQRHPDKYDGRWLAAFSQVGNTELVVGVQQHYDQAVAPTHELLRQLLRWAAGAGAVLAVALGAAWVVRRRGRSGR